MNITTTKSFQNVLLALGAGLVALVAVISLPAPAHAQEFGDGGGFGDIGSMDGGGGGFYDSSGFGDTGSCGSACGGTFYDSSGFGDTGSCGSACGSNFDTNPYYDYGYNYGYGNYGYTPSYFSPSYFSPPSNTNVNQNTNVVTNTNTCTNGSCNTAINAPTTINNSGGGSSYPVYQPVYVPSPQPVYYPQQPVYQPYQQPIAYNRPAPYVSLAAVPYTGLDLGPWGTVAYWGFLILWCLGAAYLIVVKRVQNKLVSGLNSFLFSTQSKQSEKIVWPASASETGDPRTFSKIVSTKSTPSAQFSGIDPFIASQIHRAAF